MSNILAMLYYHSIIVGRMFLVNFNNIPSCRQKRSWDMRNTLGCCSTFCTKKLRSSLWTLSLRTRMWPCLPMINKLVCTMDTENTGTKFGEFYRDLILFHLRWKHTVNEINIYILWGWIWKWCLRIVDRLWNIYMYNFLYQSFINDNIQRLFINQEFLYTVSYHATRVPDFLRDRGLLEV